MKLEPYSAAKNWPTVQVHILKKQITKPMVKKFSSEDVVNYTVMEKRA